MADNGHDITMPARLRPQNAKAILGIMVRDGLDEPGKYLLRLICGRVFHGRCDDATNWRRSISAIVQSLDLSRQPGAVAGRKYERWSSGVRGERSIMRPPARALSYGVIANARHRKISAIGH
jgi:hypothetical protein